MTEVGGALLGMGWVRVPGSGEAVAGSVLNHERQKVLLGVAFSVGGGVLRLEAAGEGHHLVSAEYDAWWRSLGRPSARPLLGRLEGLGIPARTGSSKLAPWVAMLPRPAAGLLLDRH